jgi:hypothetical protein
MRACLPKRPGLQARPWKGPALGPQETLTLHSGA